MTEYKQIKDSGEVYKTILQFHDCFPDLLHRVGDIKQYANKLALLGKFEVQIYNDEIVGLVAYYENDNISNVGFISLIGILPNYQGKGFGKALLSYVIKQMEKAGMKTIKLEVDINNIRAINYYQKNCFNTIGYARENSYYMLRKV